MKRELRNEHPMLLEVEDRGGKGCLIGEVFYGGVKRHRFAVSPSKRGTGQRFLKSFIEREMEQLGKAGRRKVYRTSFDLLNVFGWLRKDPKAAQIYHLDGKGRLLRHLNSLKEVLTDPLPSREEVRGLLSQDSPLRSRYEKLEGKLDGDHPKGGVSKEVYVRMCGAGAEYEDYREKADEELERVNETIRSLKNTIHEIEYF
ncbi:hypothetical protein AKJ41_04680 [candidate division MSBL1 archaeon SCGC-AAA259O05]|uniref:Uncharacterized protein n=1 Tax=candidate division MSBL1 archaeon SCGC-AAA259O05 TaxID=1698271 RepID=A0A133V0E1_9EURY|nr:hypothetical protein AKJ41_04680 [candidate division MSBL1 archaeon SCGC-AAA259O05]